MNTFRKIYAWFRTLFTNSISIDVKLDKDYAKVFQRLKLQYGGKLAKLNGFANSQLDYTTFIDNFIDTNTVADASIDGSANVGHKDICTLMSESNKPHMKLLSFNKIFYEMKKTWGLKEAISWLISEWIGKSYCHDSDSASLKSYCFAYDLQDLAEKGLYFIDGANVEPAKHLDTWVDHVGEFVSWTSNRTSGACGLPSYLIYAYYFWKKDVEAGYYPKSPEAWRDQCAQRIIYKLNGCWVRINQSAFTNFSIFDRNYLIELFGGKQFPDGSYMIDSIEEILEFQMSFLHILADIRSKNMMTFPVMSYMLLFQNGKFVDEEYAMECCKHNMKWADGSFGAFSDVTSMSNCCRLQSDIKQLGYFNSIGGTQLKVGSVKVNTINLARLSYETNTVEDYLDELKKRTMLCCKLLDTVRHIIKRNIEKHLLPNYSKHVIDLENQYNTIGIIGVFETLEKFGMITVDEFGNHYYTDEGMDFAVKILAAIADTAKEFKSKYDRSYLINIEQIPAERAAAVMMYKDQMFFPNQKYTLPLYGNQWIPLGVKCTMKEKIRVSAILDKACSGGASAHVNIATPFSTFEEAWDMLNYVAKSGCQFFSFNYKISACDQNHGFFGETCPHCGGPKVTTYQRIVGFLVPDKNYSKERKAESERRTYFNNVLSGDDLA